MCTTNIFKKFRAHDSYIIYYKNRQVVSESFFLFLKEEIFTMDSFSVSIICRVLKLALSSHDKNIQLCYDPNEQDKETKKNPPPP